MRTARCKVRTEASSPRCARERRRGAEPAPSRSRLHARLPAVALLLGSAAAGALLGAPAGRPPHRRLSAPAPGAVVLEDELWAPRIRRCREVMLPYCFERCRATGRIANFRRAAGEAEGEFQGAHFNDSDVYKIVEGADRMLALGADPRLQRLSDETVALIARAQDSDGYLDTFFSGKRRAERFEHIAKGARHELYCMGHAIEAASVRFELRGRRDFLEVARRLADHIGSIFGPGKRHDVPEHQEIEIALLRLFEVTGERRYLDLARFFIEERGNAAGHELYGEYAQDHLPIREQREVVGHAVRAMYNCSAAADLYAWTGDAKLLAALRRLWQSATRRKMYVTGGVGATAKAEAFSADYVLPNETAYSETCAQIGLLLFAHRMLLLDPDAEYADVLERVLYNAFLSGSSLSGDRFFYQNRLASRGDYRRQPWYSCACCPSNVVRVFPRIGELLYSISKDAIDVNLYAASRARLRVAGTSVSLRQETRYPWDGRVVLRVDPAEPRELTLRLRVPGWLRGRESPGGLYRWGEDGEAPPRATLRVGGGAGVELDPARLEKGYASIRRRWRAGDVVELELPMEPRRVRAHPAVHADRGRVALARGPIVYCVEEADLGRPVGDVVLPPEAKLRAEHRADLLGGVTVLRARALAPPRGGSGAALEPVDLVAVPYAVWDNRAGGSMAVWLTEDPEKTRPIETAGWVGSNYTPAWCVNQVQMWHEFRPEVIERELAAAQEHLAITSLRVYLHEIPWRAERERFLSRIEQFLAIAARHGIRPGFVFFDDCHRREGITLESPPPVKGWHNGRWAACPQDRERRQENFPRFRAYVQDVIRAHAHDPRVLWWETYNEPDLRQEFSVKLRAAAYRWAKEVGPEQPVIACWDDHPATDLVDAHNYRASFGRWGRQADLNPAKGAVFTEAGARWYALRPSSAEPCEVIRWLRSRRAAGRYVPGVYLAWELMAGNSNCRWYWGTEHGAPEPTIPWCGLLWPDGTPVSLAEAEAIRSYVTGEPRALLFDDFQSPPPPRPGWTSYGGEEAGGSGVLRLGAGRKVIAGEASWRDYVLEARVRLEGERGNAGVVFRVSDPGPGPDEMRGYYAGFDTRTLYLGKMENRWRQLATFDLARLDCRVVPGVWNLLRVEARGARIRVWLDRMLGENGLRIDFTDSAAPILSGKVGLRAHGGPAQFDDVVVLEASKALPEASKALEPEGKRDR